MNTISRNKVLLTIIAVLLIANIAMLVFFFRFHNHPPEEKRPGFTEKLKSQVGFSADQMKIAVPKKDAFWKDMRGRFEEMKKTKEKFYYQLYDPSIPDSVIELKAEKIGELQKQMDLKVIKHFKEIRKLCTPEQLPRFDSLLPPIIERMTARPGKK